MFSKTKSTEILNREFVNATCFLALYSNNPTVNDTGTEINGLGYTRQEIEFSIPIEEEAGKMTIKNNNEIRFPIAESDWGIVTHVGIRTSQTGGNLIAFGELNNPRSILTGDRFTIDLNGGIVRLS